MYFLIRSAYLIVFILLQGCATVATHQSNCEKQYSKFPNMVSCLKRSIKNDVNLQTSFNNDLINLYLSYADALRIKVIERKISEEDARLALASFYTDIVNEMSYRQQKQAEALDKAIQALATYEAATRPIPLPPVSPPPRPVTCIRNGNITNCY